MLGPMMVGAPPSTLEISIHLKYLRSSFIFFVGQQVGWGWVPAFLGDYCGAELVGVELHSCDVLGSLLLLHQHLSASPPYHHHHDLWQCLREGGRASSSPVILILPAFTTWRPPRSPSTPSSFSDLPTVHFLSSWRELTFESFTLTWAPTFRPSPSFALCLHRHWRHWSIHQSNNTRWNNFNYIKRWNKRLLKKFLRKKSSSPTVAVQSRRRASVDWIPRGKQQLRPPSAGVDPSPGAGAQHLQRNNIVAAARNHTLAFSSPAWKHTPSDIERKRIRSGSHHRT